MWMAPRCKILFLPYFHKSHCVSLELNISRFTTKTEKKKDKIDNALNNQNTPNQRTFYLRSGWRGNSLSGLLTVKGTGMREQGSLKGEGTHRGNLCVEIFKPNLP